MVNLSYHSGRNILRGFLDYAESRPDWQVSIRTPTGEDFAAFAADVRDGKVDGLVTSEMEDASFARIVEQASFPVVVIGTREDCIPARTRNVVFVTTDETLIAQTAAKHLLSVGSFASFGFVHAQLRHCHYLSTLRQAGFAAAIAAARRPCHSFPEGGLDDFLSFDEQALGAWLSGLPRPVGVCAAGDRGGTAVIRACRQAGLRVPEDVSVIGINDDALCCRSVRPSLSSVFTDNRGEGRCAAAELGRLICARRPHLGRPLVVRRPDCSVTVRDSTRILPSGLVLVERARRLRPRRRRAPARLPAPPRPPLPGVLEAVAPRGDPRRPDRGRQARAPRGQAVDRVRLARLRLREPEPPEGPLPGARRHDDVPLATVAGRALTPVPQAPDARARPGDRSNSTFTTALRRAEGSSMYCVKGESEKTLLGRGL